MKTPLRIFGAVNHIGNQYEMLKLAEHYDCEFTYLENNVRRWSRNSARPMPKHLKWATAYEPGKYDLAILHVDQQHADPAIGKGRLYRELNEVIQDIPKIVINHGTPMWDEMFTEDLVINGGDMRDRKGKTKHIDGIKKITEGNFMVVNSYHAVERWGWGYPLIHGMSPDEWYDLPKEPRVVTQGSAAGLDKYYGRQLRSAIAERVREQVGTFLANIGTDVRPDDWQEQREILGRTLLFVSQQFDTPMSRSRTEAMLSGCCVLTGRHDDAERFIENGVNGFLVPDNPLSYSELINQLINFKYQDAIEIGQRGKATAVKFFNTERYLKDLWHIVSEVANGRQPVWNGGTIYD